MCQWTEAVETVDGTVFAQAVKCLMHVLAAHRQRFETLLVQEKSRNGHQQLSPYLEGPS